MPTKEMEFHELANNLSVLPKAELEILADSIAQGYDSHHPIVTLDGKILDGRNRYIACKLAGVKPIFEEYTGNDPLAFIIRENVTRRHLDESQRAMFAARLANMPKGNFSKSANLPISPISQPEAAKKLNVSKRSVGSAKKVLSEGSSALIASVDAGQIPVSVAVKVSKSTKMAQNKVAKRVAKGEKPANAIKKVNIEEKHKMVDALPEAPIGNGLKIDSIMVCDIANINMPDESIDMIFTDPPYHDEYLDCYSKLAALAQRVLKPGGMLLTYCGKMFLPQIHAALGECLEYVWEFSVFQPFSKSKINKHNLFENWRPILCYRKIGKTKTREWVQDVVRGVRQKEVHEWQQDMEAPLQYIAAYTLPGQVVLDPFVGGGTTPKACKEIKRHYVCFDIDPDAVKLSIKRIADE